MNTFVRRFVRKLNSSVLRMNCCHNLALAQNNESSVVLTLPGGISIMVNSPACCENEDFDYGTVYVDEFGIESPELCPEDLAVWTNSCLACCRKINQAFAAMSTRGTKLNSALSFEEGDRIKRVWIAAQKAVDLPKGFRYTAFRENKNDNLVLSTLMYTSSTLNSTTWVTKSSLSCVFDEEPNLDNWGFEPNYSPDSEAQIEHHREGYTVNMQSGLYLYESKGDTSEARDKQAAYWLVGLLSDMVDSILQSPPARVYEYFLSDGIAELKKSALDKMTKAGLTRLLKKGFVDPEKVLRVKPELFRVMLEKDLIAPEIVARRLPTKLQWLVQNGYISADYAIKLNPALKDKLIRAGHYAETTDISDDPESLIQAVSEGTIKPIDAYRANPKVLQSLVENKLITPQEAYKIDASIVTWLLINHYIGKQEAMKLRPDMKSYLARRHPDVDWESLDASVDVAASRRYNNEDYEEDWELISRKDVLDWDGFNTEYSWYRNKNDGLNVFVFGDSDMYYPEDTEWDFETEDDEEAQNWFDNYEGAYEEEEEDYTPASRKQAIDDYWVDDEYERARDLQMEEDLNNSRKLNSDWGEEPSDDPGITRVNYADLTDESLQAALAKSIGKDPDTPHTIIEMGEFQIWVAPAGYEDNALILSGDLAAANVYVQLVENYSVVKIDDSYEQKMKGNEVLEFARNSASDSVMPENALEERKHPVIVGERDYAGTHWFVVEGPEIGDVFKYRNQLIKLLPNVEVEDSGFSDTFWVSNTSKEELQAALEQINLPLNSSVDLDSGDYSGYGDLESVSEDVSSTALDGPAWLVTASFPGDELSRYTTSLILPGEDKTTANAKYQEAMQKIGLAEYGHIMSWDEQIPSVQAWKKEHPHSNYRVLT